MSLQLSPVSRLFGLSLEIIFFRSSIFSINFRKTELSATAIYDWCNYIK